METTKAIGLISDVHGNVEALASAWHLLAKSLPDDSLILNAGDNVGYGANPEETVQFLRRARNTITVQGNYDRVIAKYPGKSDDYRKRWSKSRPEKLDAVKHDSDRISDETREWLLELPVAVDLEVIGLKVLLTHYGPRSKEGIGKWTSDDELFELSNLTDADVVVCGHTHVPFVRRSGRVLFVNPGSIGRSFNGAYSYAVLSQSSTGSPEAAHYSGTLK